MMAVHLRILYRRCGLFWYGLPEWVQTSSVALLILAWMFLALTVLAA